MTYTPTRRPPPWYLRRVPDPGGLTVASLIVLAAAALPLTLAACLLLQILDAAVRP